MNGHSKSESLAFIMLEVARSSTEPLGDVDDSPVFIFAAGSQAGANEVVQWLAPVISVASGRGFDASLIDGLAHQVARLKAGDSIARQSLREQRPGVHGDAAAFCMPVLVAAQAQFLRMLCAGSEQSATRWGAAFTDLTGDYSLYLKLLFPRARFVFLHRNPLDTFRAYLHVMAVDGRLPARDPGWARSFADHWSTAVASFELWRGHVDGIMISYDRALSNEASELEQYLGERLPSPGLRAESRDSTVELHADDVELIGARAGELAGRCGYRILAASTSPAKKVPQQGGTAPCNPSMRHARDCAVLVPTARYIEPECEAALRQLEDRGYAVRRLHGCSAIDMGRNRLATLALEEGFGETLWVDADMAFNPDDVDRLRSHDLPIVCGIYPKKGGRELATAVLPGTQSVTFGHRGGVIEILYAATGFLLVKRLVYDAIQRRFELPLCNPSAPHRAIPFFMPMLEYWPGEMGYLAEDYAFSRRARLCGFKIMADTTIRLWHIGPYRYGFEDASHEVHRLDTYEHVLRNDAREAR